MTRSGTVSSRDDYVFTISGTRYMAPRSRLDLALPIPNYALVAVVTLPQHESIQITVEWLQDRLGLYSKDDVFNNSFLANIVFHSPEQDTVAFTKEAADYLEGLDTQTTSVCSLSGLLPGPYVYVNQQLRHVWKLVDDSNGTCMVTLKPRSSISDPFESFPLRSSDDQFSCFALPSRIPFQVKQASPLAGLRIVIKDNIHLQGIRTSVGNRAFYNTYPPRDTSAECISKLLDLGVVVCGKTKLNSFGNWEEPTEYVDYQAPWNPRGDGYQSPGGSSSGSASAIAAYDWLDIAIGTDTWGSVTRPALWCGCYGLRPSQGAIPSKGVVPYVTSWDVPGILARDLEKCKTFATNWLDLDLFGPPQPFTSIIWPADFWTIIDHHQAQLTKHFAGVLQEELNVSLEELSFEQIWNDSPPSEANGMSLPAFINPATSSLAYDVYHNCDDFRAKYHEAFGCAPYTTLPSKKQWELGKTISKEERNEGFCNIDTYRKWFRQTILTGKHANALTILPLEAMTPRYRDQPPTFKRPPQDGIHALAIAPVLQSPVLAVPIAEIPYHSRITEKEEKIPFAVAIMGTPGTDLALLDTARNWLTRAGLPTSVETGKTIWK
ncbi:amidase signature domain-containing protein [Fusarium solani]|uniref:Amidase signature domain-containing protein n=1 Tax=Fusarium solani TaxID=169388 RepID=A0A9P9HVY8_FUSSL|nr:amidase signature domain-containing protein [Fusarium solani]KAH7264620.1 amidase signature domain-containing protein [Fusarium solani]